MNVVQLTMLAAQVGYRFLSGFENRMGYETRREWNIAKAASKNPLHLSKEDQALWDGYHSKVEKGLYKGPVPDYILEIQKRLPVSTNNEKGAYVAKLGRSTMMMILYVVFLAIASLMNRDLTDGIGPLGIFVLTACAVIGVISSLGVWNSFVTGVRDSGQLLGIKWKFLKPDIHLWETIQNGVVVLIALIGSMDMIYLWVSVVVGQILHKGEVNRAFSLPFIHRNEITDDPTGKTYGIPALDIVVRRLSNGYTRLYLGIAGMMYVIANEVFMNWELSFVNVFNYIFK